MSLFIAEQRVIVPRGTNIPSSSQVGGDRVKLSTKESSIVNQTSASSHGHDRKTDGHHDHRDENFSDSYYPAPSSSASSPVKRNDFSGRSGYLHIQRRKNSGYISPASSATSLPTGLYDRHMQYNTNINAHHHPPDREGEEAHTTSSRLHSRNSSGVEQHQHPQYAGDSSKLNDNNVY